MMCMSTGVHPLHIHLQALEAVDNCAGKYTVGLGQVALAALMAGSHALLT